MGLFGNRDQVDRVKDATRDLLKARDAHGRDSAEYRRADAALQAVKRNSSEAQSFYGALEAARRDEED